MGEKCKIYSFISKGECPLTPSSIPCGIVELSHTPPLCFATQNIGEVARSDGGVKPDNQKNSYAIFRGETEGTAVPEERG